jgi:hypothetical protein
MVGGLCRMAPVVTENMKMTPLDEKCQFLWDYYKDCFGIRPRHFEPEFWKNEHMVDGMIAYCDRYLDRMKSTAAGREELRELGWIVEEM